MNNLQLCLSTKYSRAIMDVFEAPNRTRQLNRTELLVQNSRVPKLPGTIINQQLLSSTVRLTSKTSNAHLPRLLGTLPKSLSEPNVTKDRDFFMRPKDVKAIGKDDMSPSGSAVVPPELLVLGEIPSDLPRWERDIDQAEVKTLYRRLPHSTSRGAAVSPGFWQSMKLTPGEMDLKYNQNQNSLRKPPVAVPKHTRKGASLSITKGHTQPNLRVNSPDERPKNAARNQINVSSFNVSGQVRPNRDYYDRFSRQPALTEEDPDELHMKHIVSALHGQLADSPRASNVSPGRVESRYGGRKTGKNPPTAVELALKAARRYRHPEKSAANMPMSPRKIEGVSDRSPKQPSGVERALKHSSTYETQQRHKRNKEATQSDLKNHYATSTNASFSRSMALYTLSLPLEAEPYTLHGLMKKRSSSFHSSLRQQDNSVNRDWKMHMTPREWVRLLKANPGDPILKTLGIEDGRAESLAPPPIRLPTIESTFSDTDSYISDKPASKLGGSHTELAANTYTSQEGDEREDGQVGEELFLQLGESPKTPVPFNSPESSPRSLHGSSGNEEPEVPHVSIIEDRHLLSGAGERRDIGHSEPGEMTTSIEQHVPSTDATYTKPTKKVVIVVPSNEATFSGIRGKYSNKLSNTFRV